MKKNVKGFTLVELVVVSCMMVIMMGAILNFVKPITNFYKNTWATADSNDIGIAVMDYFEDELRYSTNVLVLEDYEGVPEVSEGYLLTSSGSKAINVKYTDVIILDNENPRGSVLTSYDASKGSAHLKGAKGSIIKVTLGDTGIDFTNAQIALTEDIYSDFGAEFESSYHAATSASASNKCLSIAMSLYTPEYDGSAYVFDKLAYSQERDIELVNITNINATMKAYYYSNAVDDSGNLKGTPIDYTTFVQASNPGGLTTEQSEMYSSSHKYTYIFYTKSVPTTAATCKVQILKPSGSGYVTTVTVPTNGTLTEAQIANIKNNGTFSDSIESAGGGTWVKKTLDHFVCTTTGKTLDDYLTEPITENLEFSAVWLTEDYAVPEGYVTFLDCYDPTSGDNVGYTVQIDQQPYYVPAVESLGLDNTVTTTQTGKGDETHQFIGWYSSVDADGNPTGVAYDYDTLTASYSMSFPISGGATTFYAAYQERPKHHVIFLDENGAQISDTEYYEEITTYTSITLPYAVPDGYDQYTYYPADQIPEGKQFVGWFENGDKTLQAFNGFSSLYSDITFAPVFEDVPESGAMLTVAMSQSKTMQQTSWYPTALYKPTCTATFNLTNIGTEGTSGNSTITFTVNGSIDTVQVWGGTSSYTISGNTVTLNYTGVIYPTTDTDGSHWKKSDTITVYITGSVEGSYDYIDAYNLSITGYSNTTS